MPTPAERLGIHIALQHIMSGGRPGHACQEAEQLARACSRTLFPADARHHDLCGWMKLLAVVEDALDQLDAGILSQLHGTSILSGALLACMHAALIQHGALVQVH